MWWLSQMAAPSAPVMPEDVPAYMAAASGGGPSQNAREFSGADETVVLDQLVDLTVEVSPLVACQVLFAYYVEVDSPRPVFSDALYNPCPDGHAETFEWLSPRETLHRLCRRCGRPA